MGKQSCRKREAGIEEKRNERREREWRHIMERKQERERQVERHGERQEISTKANTADVFRLFSKTILE